MRPDRRNYKAFGFVSFVGDEKYEISSHHVLGIATHFSVDRVLANQLRRNRHYQGSARHELQSLFSLRKEMGRIPTNRAAASRKCTQSQRRTGARRLPRPKHRVYELELARAAS